MLPAFENQSINQSLALANKQTKARLPDRDPDLLEN
jgi:hypothetical protein